MTGNHKDGSRYSVIYFPIAFANGCHVALPGAISTPDYNPMTFSIKTVNKDNCSVYAKGILSNETFNGWVNMCILAIGF